MIEELKSGCANRLFALDGLPEALACLARLGVDYEDYSYDTFMERPWLGGPPKPRRGPHCYFRNHRGEEVAYYTPSMNSLVVFATPRQTEDSQRRNA